MQLQTQQPETTHAERCSTLVLGLGNILLRDEGVGVHVVRALAEVGLPADVEVFDGGTAGIDLLDVLADRHRVIVIDALDCDGPPGTVLRLEPGDLLPAAGQAVSLHEMGLLETLAVARVLGIAPRDLVILGVKPHDVKWGLDLSPKIKRLLPRIVELVLTELNVQSDAQCLCAEGQEQP